MFLFLLIILSFSPLAMAMEDGQASDVTPQGLSCILMVAYAHHELKTIQHTAQIARENGFAYIAQTAEQAAQIVEQRNKCSTLEPENEKLVKAARKLEKRLFILIPWPL